MAELELGLKSPESQCFLSTSEMPKRELGHSPKAPASTALTGGQGHHWTRDFLDPQFLHL